MDRNSGIDLPPAVHGGPFSYGSKCFVVTAAPDVERLATGRLTELLNPGIVRDSWIREKTKKEARRLIKMPWVNAHLEFYEIAYDPKYTLDARKFALKDGVEKGMCHQLPRTILEKALRLAERYNRSALKLLQEPPDSFSTASSAAMELNIDEDRFLQKYFMDSVGNFDRTRAPKPMVLVGLDNPSVMWEFDRDHKLHMKLALQGSRNILVLGWSEEQVSKLISTLESRQGEDSYSAERSLTTKNLAKYRDVLSTSLDSGLSLPRDAMGHYSMRSTEIEAQGQDQVEVMSIAIMRTPADGWIARFNFGALAGYMILDTTVSRLDARWVKSKTSTCRLMEWESDSEDDQNDGEHELIVAPIKQEIVDQTPSSPDLGATPAQTQKRSMISESEQPPKRRKICEKDGARFLFFRWQSIDSEAMLQVGANETQKGRLEFLDEGYTKFEGYLSGSFLGHKVSFQGFKMDRENEQYRGSYTGNREEAEVDW